MNLTARILWSMVAGIAMGIILNGLSNMDWLPPVVNAYLIDGALDTVGKIFIASLKLLVVPVVLVSLICGVSALGENSRIGIMAGKTIALYMFTTAIAITLALFFAGIVRPGHGMEVMGEAAFVAKEAPPIKDVLINMVPTNPFQAMANAEMLQIIIFALLFGFAISKAGETGARIKQFFSDMNSVIMQMVTILMALAPVGVFCLVTKLFAQLGVGAIIDLIKYFLTVIFVLLLHGLLVYGSLLKTLTGLNPLTFFRKLRPVLAFAFSTASSSATIPVTLRTVEEKLGADNRVAAFTVPLGATINMDGTAIMQGVATAFIAQAYGIDIGLSGYLMVILTATLASIGTAGVPGVGLITLSMVLNQVGLPVEGIAMIIGIDRLLDMIRTAVNVTGDSMVTLVVAKGEGRVAEDTYNAV